MRGEASIGLLARLERLRRRIDDRRLHRLGILLRRTWRLGIARGRLLFGIANGFVDANGIIGTHALVGKHATRQPANPIALERALR